MNTQIMQTAGKTQTRVLATNAVIRNTYRDQNQEEVSHPR